jgi:putative serine protease PepD
MNRGKWFYTVLVFLLVVLVLERDRVMEIFRPRPTAESLQFNQVDRQVETRPIIMSPEEKINMEVFERNRPAVVNIAATTLGINFWMEVIPREGQGTGFIVDKAGYILTNNHVIGKAQKITVTMADGAKHPATLVGRDPSSDLAVIKVGSDAVDAVATLGDSDGLRVGQRAIAIGNPFGLSHTLTTGIISALRREIGGEDGTAMSDLIQTDAAINPGNSGGPLLNSSGEVIGINTAIFSLSGGNQGIGFAIPINHAREIATGLITAGKVRRPWLGITGISITPDLARGLNLPVVSGILVVEVLPGGPCDRAGLRGGSREAVVGSLRLSTGGDIITGLGGKRISEMKELLNAMQRLKVDQTITLQVIRNRSALDVQVVLDERG